MSVLRGALSLLFPSDCPGCGTLVEEGVLFCDPCAWTLEPLGDHSPCPRCGEPQSQAIDGPGHRPDRLCRRCRIALPPFSRAAAGYLHHAALARAIHRLKYGDRPELADGLAQLLATGMSSFLLTAPSLICPLPLHGSRALSRAYDQAGLLAACLARHTGRTLFPAALRRVRLTRSQVGLSEAAREQNLAEAFAADPRVEGARLLLVDDVMTTGATARAATKALRAAGAREVQVLALARAASTLAHR